LNQSSLALATSLLFLYTLFLRPARADVTGDVTVTLRYWDTDSLKTTRFTNVRLLADADLHSPFRAHLDLEREEGDDTEFHEAYGEWGRGTRRVRLGRFQIPFGIYNRSELYYSGLVLDPLVQYYPFRGPQLGRSKQGLSFLWAEGSWQFEGALFGNGDGLSAFVPSRGEGSIRVQHYSGPLIIGLNALREHARDPGGGELRTAHFLGLDFRYSRPALILRGELVSGRLPGGSPRGYFVDLLYHPAVLDRATFVARTEFVRGQPGNGRSYRRHTVGLKWGLAPGTTVALNQAFDSPRTRFGLNGTIIYLWHTHRL
jgi:hypothetical protein